MPTKLEFGEEEDVDILRKYGDQGDFVIYENVGKKLVGDDSGFRIAFVDQGPNPIKKIRILKTETNRGKTFCMEIDQSRWYNSLEQLVDSCRKDPDTGVQQQFDPAQYPRRSLHRTHSMSTPDIRPSTRNTNSLHPKRSSGPIKFVSDRSKSLNSLIDDTNIDRVIYNVPKVKSLISGKEEGTYVHVIEIKKTFMLQLLRHKHRHIHLQHLLPKEHLGAVDTPIPNLEVKIEL